MAAVEVPVPIETTPEPTLEVLLPVSPVANMYFNIKNSAVSAQDLLINSVTLLPNDTYEVIYDGIQWITW